MQARLEARARVTGAHALLVAVLVQQPRGVQIERVALPPGRQPFQRPPPQRTETPQVRSRRTEAREEAREGGLTRHPADAEQLRHQGIPPEIGHVRELARLAQQTMHESQRLLPRRERVVRLRQAVRQGRRQPLAPPGAVQPGPERRRARVRTELLPGELHGD